MDDIIKIDLTKLRTEMQKLRAEGYDFYAFTHRNGLGEKKDWE